jgi:site-specific DNA-methyltransferase (adenine-specific)
MMTSDHNPCGVVETKPRRVAALASFPLKPSPVVDTRVVYCGDNLEHLARLPVACVDLIYIDPPFNSNRDYEVFWGETKEKRAFEDRHASTQAYIEFMRPRCVELARVLKKTGSLYYHCDWHASHYVKVMLDQILGENQFHGEIIWKRTSAHADAKRQWGAVHDSIFFYTGVDAYTFNPQYGAYDEHYIAQKYRHVEPDGRRYRLSDLRSPQLRPNLIYDYKGHKPHQNGWAVSRDRMEQLETEGRLHFPSKPGGRIEMKRYLDERNGMPVGNVWDDIDPVNSQADERIGYPTQKPLPLLERIITASTNENDVVLDAFCGCGTAIVAAQNLKRQWIGIDMSPTACRVMAKRLRDVCGLPEDAKLWKTGRGFIVRDLPWSAAKLRTMPPFEFENWAVIALGGIPNKTQVGDMGIDGRIYPVAAAPQKMGATTGHLEFMDVWYPVQVKQKDKAGRPDIDAFEAMMTRTDRTKGFFVSFDFTSDAMTEIGAFFKKSGKVIVPLTVDDILNEQIARKLA